MAKINKIFLVIIFSSLILISACSKSDPKLDNFAKCLSEKNVKFYGAFWCPHCANQKKLFGNSFKYVNYIECSTPDGKEQLQLCKDAAIKGYPTWEFSDGSRLEGEASFEVLSQKSGCPI